MNKKEAGIKFVFTLPVGGRVGGSGTTKDKVWDADGVVVVEAKRVQDAKKFMLVKYGSVWANVYNLDTFDNWKYFPKGIIFEHKVLVKKQFANNNLAISNTRAISGFEKNELF